MVASERAAKSDNEDAAVCLTASRAALLDDEGELSGAFVRALSLVFLRFSADARSTMAERMRSSNSKDAAVAGAALRYDDVAASTKAIAKCVLKQEELDTFARAVNDGAVMSDEEKEELREYFDVDERGDLTFTGFCEMYHLQSGGSEDETWKDLSALDFNDQLQRAEKSAASSSA